MRKEFRLMSTDYIVRADDIEQKDLKPGLCAEGNLFPEFNALDYNTYETLEEAYEALEEENYFDVRKTRDQTGERYEITEVIIVEDILDEDGEVEESIEHYHR